MASAGKTCQAALWLIEQLSRPLDANEEHTIIHDPGDIVKELGAADWLQVEEYATLCRVLTWREKEHRGKRLELDLIEASRHKIRLQSQLTTSETVLPKIESNTRELWEHILNALEPPSTRQLLSQQAILTHEDSKKLVIQVSHNWYKMVQSRLPILEKATTSVTGDCRNIQLEAKEFPVLTKVIEDKPGTLSTSHGIIISLSNPDEDKTRILSRINVGDADVDDINLVIKAWTHHGGSLGDLSGIPTYLQDQ